MFRFIAFLLSFSLFCYPAIAKETAFERVMRTNTLRCGFIHWPPGFSIDPNTKKVYGLGKDLFEGIIKLAGWDVEFVPVTLGNVPLDLSLGRIDAMCSDGPWTLTNVRVIDYTTPVIYSPVMIYHRASETRFHQYEDLNREGITFVGIEGDISVDLAMLRFPKAKLRTLMNTTDPAQMLMEVADKKADAVILDPMTASKFMDNNPERIKALSTKAPLAVYPISMSVARGESALQQTLNRASEMALNIGLVEQKASLYKRDMKYLYLPALPYKAP